jgi:hypothetical protein
MVEININNIPTGYHACENGDIIGKLDKVLKPYPGGSDKRKYYYIDLHVNKNVRFKSKLIHRLIWTAFNGSIPDGLEINHKDGDKSNNALSNLELETRSGNCKHSFELGLQNNTGINNPSCKINEEIAMTIINRIGSGDRLVDISKSMDVSINIVKDISRNKTWKHLSR